MKKITLLILTMAWSLSSSAQSLSPWTIVSQNNSSVTGKNDSLNQANSEILLQLDEVSLRKSLSEIQGKKGNAIVLTFPNNKGVFEQFKVWEYSNFDPELQEKYPDIRAYAGVGVTDPSASLHFSLSLTGIQTMVLRADSVSEFIELNPENKKLYKLKSASSRDNGNLPLICKTQDVVIAKNNGLNTDKTTANNQVFKTLRLALSCTGEYTTYFGGTVSGALAAMNATMSRVNGIYNRDLALQLVIIADNEKLIYTNAATDPYSDGSKGVDGAWSLELQENLTSVITNNGYDIGHLFGASGGGGNAGCIGCVCDAPTNRDPYGKGSGYTSPSNNKPEGDNFDIDFVAHEMGHQLGANHTFSHEIEGTSVNVEPGSGSTIMGYAGITSAYDVQVNSDDYFVHASILQIQNNLAAKSCPVNTSITVNAPIVSAGLDYTIPKGTAFILKGTGSTTNGADLTYTWEQNDSATSASGDDSFAIPTKTNGPLFRSLPPAASAVRYMPLYSSVLANKLTSKWESVSTVARTLHFVLTARDNGAPGNAQTNYDEMTVNVNGNIGPFEVSSQNTADISWIQGQAKKITWNVNNSNTLDGASNVNIKLSTDGGLTFPTILVSNTPNDGTEDIVVPNVVAKDCRILIEPTENIFYAINTTSFSIGYVVSSSCDTYTFTAPYAIPESATYKTTTITVPATTASVADVNFNVNFTHAYLSDVQMEIISPSGTTVQLFDRSCGEDNSSLELTYDDSGVELVCDTKTLQVVTPAQPLSAFNGESASGIWTFRVRDGFEGDTGTLNAASISICTKEFVLDATDLSSDSLYAFPNPNEGAFTVKFVSSGLHPIKITIYNVLGKNIFEKEYSEQTTFIEELQLGKIAAGIYFLNVTDGDRKEVRKLIIR